MTVINILTSSVPTAGSVITSDFLGDLAAGHRGDLVPRNSSTGIVEDGAGRVGTNTYNFSEVHTKALFVNGELIDFETLGDTSNQIVSGKTRTDSEQPLFLRADGSTNAVVVEGNITNLVLKIEGEQVTVDTDITISGLTAAPAINNTCLINDSDLTGQEYTKYLGEQGTTLTIDNVGSEISSRIGQFVALKHDTAEVMIAYVESATTLSHVKRGFFFDSSHSPLPRETLSDNDVLTLYSLAWVFVQNDGVSTDVTYTTPIWSSIQPSTGTAGDYWFDQVNLFWRRYNGSDWSPVNRILVGLAVCDSTNCVAARAFDFTRAFSSYINMEVEKKDDSTAQTSTLDNEISVYSNTFKYPFGRIEWSFDDHLVDGVAETGDTMYYLYITEKGAQKIDIIKPMERKDLRGFYHPFHTWRYVGIAYNDSSSDIEVAKSANDDKVREEIFVNDLASNDTNQEHYFYLVPNRTEYEVELVNSGEKRSDFAKDTGNECYIDYSVVTGIDYLNLDWYSTEVNNLSSGVGTPVAARKAGYLVDGSITIGNGGYVGVKDLTLVSQKELLRVGKTTAAGGGSPGDSGYVYVIY